MAPEAFARHTPTPERPPESDPLHDIESLRADVRRTAELRALWEKFGKPLPEPPPDVAGVKLFERDIDDAEKLMRAPEFRGDRATLELLVNRLTSYFASDQSLGAFITYAEGISSVPPRFIFRHTWTPPSVRRAFCEILERIPPEAGRANRDAFVVTARDPFGVLDSDARDTALARITELPDAAARREAVLRSFDIDVNACLQQLDRFAFDPKDRAAIFRAAAERAPDVLPPYLSQVAEDEPALAHELLGVVIAHDLLAGADAIDRFPLASKERHKREQELIASHPMDAIAQRVALGRFLKRTTIDAAMTTAFAHLDRELPRAPVARLTALDALTQQDDADITDRLTPVIRATLRDAVDAVREPFHELRRDVAEIRHVSADAVSWSNDLLDGLDRESRANDAEGHRIARMQRELGSPRVRALVIAAFTQFIGEHPFVGHGDAILTPTERFAVVEEALAGGRVVGPLDSQDEWTGWHAFAHPPRTPRERVTTREFLARLAEVSPADFVIASVTTTRTAKDLAEVIPTLQRVVPQNLRTALDSTDDAGHARIFAQADRKTAKWFVDAVCGSEEHPEDLTNFIGRIVPQRFHPFLLRHIDRYRAQGVMPYAAFPDAALALRCLTINPRLADRLSTFPESERVARIAELGALLSRHQSRGGFALASLIWYLDDNALRRGVFRTISALLDALPNAMTSKPASGLKAAGTDATKVPASVRQWRRIEEFIPFCPPGRVREFLTVWMPQLAQAERDTRTPQGRGRRSSTRARGAAVPPVDDTILLVAFRLRADPERLMVRYPFLTKHDGPFHTHDFAHARQPEALLALIDEQGDEIADSLGNSDTSYKFMHHIAQSDQPAAAWSFIRRFADSYGTMAPESERRAAITREMVLREQASRDLTGSVRYALVERRVTPITHAGAQEFTHPTFTNGRLDLISLTAPELEQLIRDRLDVLFVKDPNDLLRADAANRALADDFRSGVAQFSAGTLIHYTDADVLPSILAEGNCCGETIGMESKQDSFPLFVDVLRIREQDGPLDIVKMLTHPEYHAEYATYDRGVALVYPRRSDPQARFAGEEIPASDKRLDIHHLCFVGIPNSELGAIVLTNTVEADAFDDVLERTKAAVVKSGLYVPIVRANGELLFVPEEFDIREKAAHPYETFTDLLGDAAALDPLDRPQPSAVHEFTLSRHLLEAERHAVALAEEFGVPPEYRELIRVAARLHDIGKFEAEETGQEIANVIAAERELAKVRTLDPEAKRQILVLIRHDALLGDILRETTVDPDGTAACTPGAEKMIVEFRDRFPLPLHRTLMRVLYEADVRAVGNNMHERWQVSEKLAVLGERLFPRASPSGTLEAPL